MKQVKIIQAIAEKTNFSSWSFHWFRPADLMNDIEQASSPEQADVWLRGWLTDPETLKKVWSDMAKCILCGHSMRNCKHETVAGNMIPEWEYVGNQLWHLPLEEILEYYGKYLNV